MTESVEVPFGIAQDGRRYLTVTQLVEHPHLREFLHRFPASFDFDAEADVYWFIERSGPGRQ